MPLPDIVRAIRAAVHARGTAAQRFHARGELVAGTDTEIAVRLGDHALTVDEPESVGGGARGPNPIELALAALGSCQLITYQLHAARLGTRVDTLGVDVQADLDMRRVFGIADHDPRDAPPEATDRIRLRVHVAGPDDPARYRELQRHVDDSCPVLAMTRGSVGVHSELVVAE